MKYIYIILTLFITNYAFSQTEGEYDDEDQVVRIKSEKETDDRYGYKGTNSQKALDYYNKATDLDQKDPYLSISYFLKAIKEDPYYVEAYDNLGRMYRYTKQYELAVKYYKKSISLFPDGVTAHQNLAVAYNKMNLYEEAISEYNILVTLDPNGPEGYYGLGWMLLITATTYDVLEDALINAKKSLDLYKKDPPNFIGDSYFLIGYIYHFLGNEIKSKEYFNITKEKYLENNMIKSWEDKLEIINKL